MMLEFIGPVSHKGSNRIEWNIALDGKPHGQIWTYRAARERHPYHAKLLSGGYAQFPTYVAAQAWVEDKVFA